MTRSITDEIRERLDKYVDQLKGPGGIESGSVEEAFRQVPRHKLVDRFFVANKEYSSQSGYTEIVADPENPTAEDLDLIYSHRALVTRLGLSGMPSSSTSMPGLVANMLELLRLEPAQKVLEIGAGTGYNAALISEIVGSQTNVVTVDIQQDVVEQTLRLLKAAGYGDIKVLTRDGFLGVPEEAPFDRIVATVGLFDISPHWADQLSPDGEMLLPVYQGGAAPLLRVRKEHGSLVGRAVGGSGFMPIQGEMNPGDSQGEAGKSEPEPKIEKHPGWDLGKGMSQRWHFWFFVTASDSRASLLEVPGQDDGDTWSKWTFGLREGSSKVVVGEDELVLVGKAEHLLEKLEQLHELWESRGRPFASDFEVQFVPKDSYVPTPDTLAIERKYHYQVLTPPASDVSPTGNGVA
jgi:protein-L-isoaspartate(D-aspartate) O-methyltransferase